MNWLYALLIYFAAIWFGGILTAIAISGRRRK